MIQIVACVIYIKYFYINQFKIYTLKYVCIHINYSNNEDLRKW